MENQEINFWIYLGMVFGYIFIAYVIIVLIKKFINVLRKPAQEDRETKEPPITAEEERKKPKRAPQPPCKACGSRNIKTSPIGEIGTSSFRPGVHLTCRDCGWQITYGG